MIQYPSFINFHFLIYYRTHYGYSWQAYTQSRTSGLMVQIKPVNAKSRFFSQ